MNGAKTISHCQGKGSLAHNNRTFRPKNIDPSRSRDNVTFVKIPIAEAYEKLFGAAVERYNAKQKRNDRKIKSGYFEYRFGRKVSQNVVTSADKRKSFYEDVVQIGTMHDTGVGTPDAETAAECLTEYMNGFRERNPNFYVFNAVLHMDEATPHLHIDYIPVGHYTRGVDTQNGIAQALKEMGYGCGKDAIARWRQSEYEALREICMRRGLQISEPKRSRGYSMKCEEYKEYAAEKERLESDLLPLREMSLAAEESDISGKKQIFSSNVSVSTAELEKLRTEKKAAAVQTTLAQIALGSIDTKSAVVSHREERLKVREQELADSENKCDEMLREAENAKSAAEYSLSAANAKMREAGKMYEVQANLNKLLEDTQKQLEDEQDKSYEFEAQLTDALGISKLSGREKIIKRCRGLSEKMDSFKRICEDEKCGGGIWGTEADPEMLREHIAKINARLEQTETENRKNISAIARLNERLEHIRNTFIAVIKSIGVLSCEERFARQLSEYAKACIDSARYYAIKHLENYDADIAEAVRTPEMNSEIEKNTEFFLEDNSEITQNYNRNR